MDGLRVIKRSLAVMGVSLGSLLVVGMITAPDDRPDDAPNRSTTAGATSGYSHDLLQIDANMTQQMSTANANTGAQSHLRDGQLARSQDPSYLAALEQHQADINRMLGLASP